ncbi:MAG: hypothetical protein JO210_18480 [Acidobacteriaceae bacterium]|nr:hypothetical protein [Acidobacteriaceae bacterium]
MRFQLTERPSEFLLDAIHLMEKGPTVDIELTAAEFPIRSEKEMVSKDFVFAIGEGTPAYKAKIGNKLLVFKTPDGLPLPTRVRF